MLPLPNQEVESITVLWNQKSCNCSTLRLNQKWCGMTSVAGSEKENSSHLTPLFFLRCSHPPPSEPSHMESPWYIFQLTAQLRSKMTPSVAKHVNGKPSDDFRPQPSSNPSWHQREQRRVIPTESCQNYRFMSKINTILSKKIGGSLLCSHCIWSIIKIKMILCIKRHH